MTTPYVIFQTGDDQTLFSSVSSNTPTGSVDIFTNGTATNTILTGLFTVSAPANLNVFLDVTNSASLTIWQQNPNNVLFTTTTKNTWLSASQIYPNTQYGYTNVTATQGTSGTTWKLQLGQSLTVQSFFPAGFQNLIPIGPSVSFTTNLVTGSVLYNFTSYPIVAGQPIALSRTSYSLNNGTVTTTSSDTAKIPDEALVYTAPSGLNINLLPIATGTFTGTVALTVVGAGTNAYINTAYVRS